ncbi:MAG: hypothetical protein U9N45_07950, partial [Gemmatimonadota bacterium]|nr:hypothetical protein [Gemmatimonadota bacterium]
LITALLCLSSTLPAAARDLEVETALEHGRQAQEALVRSKRVMEAWLGRLDPATGLLPRTGKNPAWYVRDSAADLYPFLVMAAWFTDRPLYEGTMHEILRNEISHTTRVGMLSDNVLPGGRGFEHEDADLDRIIFGSCEYAKDGLLPLTELLGHRAWYDRLLGIADDMIKYAPYETRFGRLPSVGSEVNGEFLQVLSRLSYLTGNPSYISQAVRIGDFYFQEVIPKSNGLPVHLWDIGKGRPAVKELHLNDHGNEIAGGLAELVLYLKETGHPAYGRFEEPLSAMVHRLLDWGLNEDGVWYMRISLDGEPTDSRHAHCWGYLFNAVYTAYLVTEETRFLEAVKHALETVTEKPTYLDDPAGGGRNWGSNAYSDAIESAIVFLNRLPNEKTFQVLDRCVERFLARQREDGIIEDWYGDGNFVRTSLMYAMMKSRGCRLAPWRPDLRLGAVDKGDGLLLTLESGSPWGGKIHFDYPRHRAHFNLSVNYPRLNEFPEWFVVEGDRLYEVSIDGEKSVFMGAELVQGIEVKAEGSGAATIIVSPLDGPPYGGDSGTH